MTSGSLWKYYRDEMNDDTNENIADDYNISNIKITKNIWVFSLKYLSNFWRSLILPDTNFAIELDL